MNAVRYFPAITLAEWPIESVYRRLGYRRASTRLTTGQREETERYIAEGIDLIRLQGAALRLPVRTVSTDRVTLTDEVEFESRNLAAFLRDAREVVLMGATAGKEIMEAIENDTTGDRVTRAVVLDAAASEAVDSALDWIMGYLGRQLLREGRMLMQTRYSAGYGDLALENQRVIHGLLGLEGLGVGITERCILVPEKSVTAITGILS